MLDSADSTPTEPTPSWGGRSSSSLRCDISARSTWWYRVEGSGKALALGDVSAIPTPRQVRTISAATLAARFATWDVVVADRRSSLAAQLIDALDPDAAPFLAEMLEHAAMVLDMGKAIDHYERFEHAAMIVTTADLAGFTHEALGILSAILRYAGGGDEPRSVRST